MRNLTCTRIIGCCLVRLCHMAMIEKQASGDGIFWITHFGIVMMRPIESQCSVPNRYLGPVKIRDTLK